jgi:putative transcriptional regulator
MVDAEKAGVETAAVLLKKAGFTVSQTCRSRPSCFDFAARLKNRLVFVKVQPDIDSLCPSDSIELRRISTDIPATSLFIAEKARDKPLEDDTAYSRYGVPTLTTRTLENILLRDMYPLIQAGPGGCYVEIDGSAIKIRRQEIGLSEGKLAQMAGISRRTLYGYERGMAKSSVPVAYKVMTTLGIPIAKPVDIFAPRKTQGTCRLLITARRLISRNRLLTKIFEKFEKYKVTAVKRAPFDFMIVVPENKMRILGGITDPKEQNLDRRIEEILSISKIVEAHPVLLTERRRPAAKDISCIRDEELAEIKNPEDLIKHVT